MHTNALLAASTQQTEHGHYQVIRRNGQLTGFDASKIQVAITKAFLAVEGSKASDSHRIRNIAAQLTEQIIDGLFRRLPDGGTVHIEDIQDQVELALMRNGHHKIARAYVLYREEHARQRQNDEVENTANETPPLRVTLADGSQQALNQMLLKQIIDEACVDLADVDAELVFREAIRNLFDGITENDIEDLIGVKPNFIAEPE